MFSRVVQILVLQYLISSSYLFDLPNWCPLIVIFNIGIHIPQSHIVNRNLFKDLCISIIEKIDIILIYDNIK